MEEVIFSVTEGRVTCVPASIRMNPVYKVARGKYIVTNSVEPAKVRDLYLAQVQDIEVKKEATKLPAAVRESPKKLMKAIMGDSADNYDADKYLDGFDTENDDDEDVESLMKQCGIEY